MHLKILGCGTILQKGTSTNCSGYLLDQHLLFDCGPGIWQALNQYGISLEQISHIFITHFHVDHSSDIGPLLLNRFLIKELRNISLKIIGPPGIFEWFANLKTLLGRWSEDLFIDLTVIQEDSLQIGEYNVTSLSTGHTETSICYRVEHKGKSFFYSGDTGYNENVISMATQCDVAVIEASNSTDTHIEEHLTPQLAGRIACQAGVKKLVLTHMYPDVLAGDPIKEASSEFSGKITLAKEGMSLRF